MEHIFPAEIDDIVSIIKTTNPEKILLFGSYASGEGDNASDIDLLVVASSDEPPLERRLKLRRMLKKYDRRFGLDLLVYTPDEFNMLKNEPSSFIYSSIRNGIMLYDTETC
jgi:uncharacterized protein